ncbi:MAG: ankyrin repeat domain-containing protein [Actinomycetota bacterium]|nr:ankyrin repeat domain-containing protein [Actinomycetota bacterium]
MTQAATERDAQRSTSANDNRMMTAERFAGLVEAGDNQTVQDSLEAHPDLVNSSVERDHVTGWTPLHLALRRGHADVVRSLLSAGADLSARTEHGRTPLHICLQYNRLLRGELLAAGAEVDNAVAAYFDEADLLREHLDRDPSALDDETTGMTPLRWAAYGSADSVTRLLIERGARLDGALSAAAEVNGVAVARLLLAAGADPSWADPDTGETALHFAARHTSRTDNTDVARELLEAGADVDMVSSDGVTAVDIARIGAARQSGEDSEHRTAYADMVALLLEFGARD